MLINETNTRQIKKPHLKNFQLKTSLENTESILEVGFIQNPSKTNHFRVWKWLQILVLLFIFSVILLCCAPYHRPNTDRLTVDHFENLLDNNASCSIPNYAQVIHLPQMHKISSDFNLSFPEETVQLLEEQIAHSQFLLAQLISRYHSAVIFDEGNDVIITQNSPKKSIVYFTIQDKNGQDRIVFLRDISLIFDGRLPHSYDELNDVQKRILIELGAAWVAFGLNNIKIIHRVMTPTESDKLQAQLISWVDNREEIAMEREFLQDHVQEAHEENDVKRIRHIKEKFAQNYQALLDSDAEFDDFAIYKRERILEREVKSFLQKSNHHMQAIVIYGAAHDFSDNFKEYDFYTLPYACSLPPSYLNSPFHAVALLSLANRMSRNANGISFNQFQHIKSLYRKSYDILITFVSDHVHQGGDVKDETILWSSMENRYFSYEELSRMSEDVYLDLVALEDIEREHMIAIINKKDLSLEFLHSS